MIIHFWGKTLDIPDDLAQRSMQLGFDDFSDEFDIKIIIKNAVQIYLE